MRLGVAPGAHARPVRRESAAACSAGHRDSLFLLLQAAVAPA